MSFNGVARVLAAAGAMVIAAAGPAVAANTTGKTGHGAVGVAPGTYCQHPGTQACRQAVAHRAALDASRARAAELARVHQLAAAADARRLVEARQAAQRLAAAQAAQRAFGAAGLARFPQRSPSGNPFGQLLNRNGQHSAAAGAPRGFVRHYTR